MIFIPRKILVSSSFSVKIRLVIDRSIRIFSVLFGFLRRRFQGPQMSPESSFACVSPESSRKNHHSPQQPFSGQRYRKPLKHPLLAPLSDKNMKIKSLFIFLFNCLSFLCNFWPRVSSSCLVANLQMHRWMLEMKKAEISCINFAAHRRSQHHLILYMLLFNLSYKNSLFDRRIASGNFLSKNFAQNRQLLREHDFY